MSTASLLWSVLFGSVGVGYFMYGKKQQKISALISGAALCGYTLLVSNTYLVVGLGIALMAVPFLTDF